MRTICQLSMSLIVLKSKCGYKDNNKKGNYIHFSTKNYFHKPCEAKSFVCKEKVS